MSSVARAALKRGCAVASPTPLNRTDQLPASSTHSKLSSITMERKVLPIEQLNPAPLIFSATAEFEPYLPPKRDNNDSSSAMYPHVTLTYAQSLDGQSRSLLSKFQTQTHSENQLLDECLTHVVSLQPGAQTVLSGPETKAMTHFLRASHDAILVGVGTAKADNPGLNTRYSEDGTNIVGYDRQPQPFVLDPSTRWTVEDTPKLFSLAKHAQGKPPSWIMGTEGGVDSRMIDKVKAAQGLALYGGAYKGREDGVDWDTILRAMAKKGVRSVMIEGGGAVIKDLLRKRNQKYISSVIVTIAPTYLGAGGVNIAPRRSVETENEANLKDVRWIPLGQDVVMVGKIK